MNSALKPVLPGVPQPGAGGQGSPAKGNVANANHSVGLPQGAQNSLHHPTNSLVGQNLTHHVPNVPVAAPHPVPSMAPVSANMAQMAQNMSHHGNLSHVTQNSTPPPVLAPSPAKPATSSPLSLVQDKPQPLALTRTPEKKEPDSTGQSNGTIEAPKSASNAPAPLKAQNPETNKDKQDIAKTSPSTPKPPEKPANAQNTPQKMESAAPASQADTPAQPKVATASEAPEKSPSKPVEPKPAPTADVAPTQSDSKPVPESAKDSQEKPNATTNKVEPSASQSAKIENPVKPEEKKEEPKVEKPTPNAVEEKKEEVKADKAEPSKKEEPVAEKQEKEQKPQKVEEKEKTEEKKPEPKPEVKTPAKPEVAKATPKSTLKLATVTPTRKRRASPKASDGPTPAKKAADGDSAATPDARTRRNRTQVQLYQSPTPEIAMATKLSASAGRSTPTKPNDDKLIVFYKNEYLAVRNAEGGFYVCQAMQNVYRTTRKIKIRWLSQDKAADPSGETYKPDFYDTTDMECVLTTLSMTRASSASGAGAGAWCLRAAEAARAGSILGRALKAERGDTTADLTEEHPDGLDLSLYTDESQLEKKSRKRAASKSSPRKQEPSDDAAEAAPSAKRPRPTPKRSPKSARKLKQSPPKQNNKRKSAGSTPNVASISKTATAVSESPKVSPRTATAKRAPKPAPAPVATPTRQGRRAAKAEPKPAPAPTPSTSTGKATRTPRKPPAKK